MVDLVTAATAVCPVHVCEANNLLMAHVDRFTEIRSAAHFPEDLAALVVATVAMATCTVALRVFRVPATAQVALMAAD